jgi:hypothetical protein
MDRNGKPSMEREEIKCFFCGGIARIMERDNLKIVICPQCKRETDLISYQDQFDDWLGDIRNEDGKR